MEGHISHTGVLQLLIQTLLLSIAFEVSQIKAENHEILSKKVYRSCIS